jgi:RHS repeat-associated protein
MVRPFGNQRGGATDWISAHGFLDKAASSFSGLTQLGARAYDATLGRFLSVDPVLNPDAPQQDNGYAYSGNNPIANADPSGLCPTNLCAIGGGSRPKPMPGPVPFPWKGATTAPSTHVHHTTPVQPYGRGGSKSANYSSAKKQAQTGKAIRRWAPVIILTAADILLTAGVIACTVATAGICAVAGGGELEAAGIAADAEAIGSTIAAESEAQAAAAEAKSLTGAFSRSEIDAASAARDKGGLTRVGRALQKHSDRSGSVFEGKSTGTTAQRNAQGSAALDKILRDPGLTVKQGKNVTEYFSGGGGGFRMSNDGTFMGFLEPKG